MSGWCERHPNVMVVLLVLVFVLMAALNGVYDSRHGQPSWWQWALRLSFYVWLTMNIQRWWRRT
jgi:hypothetical protein